MQGDQELHACVRTECCSDLRRIGCSRGRVGHGPKWRVGSRRRCIWGGSCQHICLHSRETWNVMVAVGSDVEHQQPRQSVAQTREG